MSVSSSSSWTEFFDHLNANPQLTNQSTDISLQPGEEYPQAPHTYMIAATKCKESTMNQILRLINTRASEIPIEHKVAFKSHKKSKEAKWLYPYNEENPCGTLVFEHWLIRFNTAVIEIVSKQFRRGKRVSKEGTDLFAQGRAQLSGNDSTGSQSHSAHAI